MRTEYLQDLQIVIQLGPGGVFLAIVIVVAMAVVISIISK